MKVNRSVSIRAKSNALVSQKSGRAKDVLGHSLVIVPPRPIPLVMKTRRACSKLVSYSLVALTLIGAGFVLAEPTMRRQIDYHTTLAFSTGLSNFSRNAVKHAVVTEPLSKFTNHLFVEGQKGPRADRYGMVVSYVEPIQDGLRHDKIARHAKAAVLDIGKEEVDRIQPAIQTMQAPQTAVLAGASLFMAAFEHNDATPLPSSEKAEMLKASSWSSLLKNASLAPDVKEKSSTLFGGLTEDEFRERELRCMATAIYFEARDEPIKGQMAVGQVIMNRIRSPYYPKTICGVVYQGERLRTGCQFSFTCNGKKNHITEKPEWATSVKIAKQVIAREVWIDELARSTHYHATYVKPEWRHEFNRVTMIGSHIFYQPKPGTMQVALLSD